MKITRTQLLVGLVIACFVLAAVHLITCRKLPTNRVWLEAEAPPGEPAGWDLRAYHEPGSMAYLYGLVDGDNKASIVADIDGVTKLTISKNGISTDGNNSWEFGGVEDGLVQVRINGKLYRLYAKEE